MMMKVMKLVTSPMVKLSKNVINHLMKKPTTLSSERESISMNSASQKLCLRANSCHRSRPTNSNASDGALVRR